MTTTSWIHLGVEGAWMVVLQVGLLKVHYYAHRNPKLKPLSTFEIWSVVGVCWGLFLLSAAAVGGLLGVSFATERKSCVWTWLGYETLWTWALHRGLRFGLETLIPLAMVARFDSTAVLNKIQARVAEVAECFGEVHWGSLFATGFIPDSSYGTIEKKSCQMISLERHQSDDPVEGARTLDWTIAIDKKALDEMKETLGPPGGFGEMGFNVSKDRICFEAMGVGTRFNLSFSLKKPRNGDTTIRSLKKRGESSL